MPLSTLLWISIALHLVREPSSLRALVAISFDYSSFPCILYLSERAKKSSTMLYKVSLSCNLHIQVFSPSLNWYHVISPPSLVSQASKSMLHSFSVRLGILPIMHSSFSNLPMISVKFSFVTPFLSVSYFMKSSLTWFFSHSTSLSSVFWPNWSLFSYFLLGVGMPS